MNLSRHNLKDISEKNVIVPDQKIFDLPEKVLQFGTGMLLRGLPGYFIDKANKKGIFNGRAVVVKSTSKGDATAFEKQDNLYTLCVRGIVNGEKKEENIVCSSISRVLIAQHEWPQILECAHNRNLEIIISNTTEVGIQLMNEDIRKLPPVSFPGKLLGFLYERFIAFKGSQNAGLVIIPTELIPDNGKILKSIVLKLAVFNALENNFIEWLESSNYFCNSLVDRIVTGMPGEEIKNSIENELGYKDDLLTVCEPYHLWAIEGNEKIKGILSFAAADEGVVIAPNIDLYRELKLRLLNATHTLTCGLAFLAKCDTVREAMEDGMMRTFIERLMRNEISPSIPYEINDAVKEDFISHVLDRFRNPYINHHWKNITLNYTSKMRMRCIPLLVNFCKINKSAPQLFSLGFASYLYFMKAASQNGKEYFGEIDDKPYLIEDEMAGKLYTLWQQKSVEGLVKEIAKDTALWGCDLSTLPGFQRSVADNINGIINNGMKVTLENVISKNKQAV